MVPLSLFFDNHQLEKVKRHKHLGLIISHNLSWKEHIQSITENAIKKLNIISKVGNTLDRKSLTIMSPLDHEFSASSMGAHTIQSYSNLLYPYHFFYKFSFSMQVKLCPWQ